PRRPHPGRRRPCEQHQGAAGQEPHPRHHEGWRVPQGAGRDAAPPGRGDLRDDLRARRAVAMKLFLLTFLNGLTAAGLYSLVASGFTLVFGLMRNVNLAHGSPYLLGAYLAYEVGDLTGSWYLAVVAGFLCAAIFGILLQILVFRRMEGQELQQTLVTIGVSI